MPVPKRRTSKSKRNKRRSHDALVIPQWSVCSKCG
ncbi:MAG: 50S ribosomal protein L32, partial [Candidatus Binatia bacterium]